MKRSNTPPTSSNPVKKGNWLTQVKAPAILVHSKPITDRGSTFIAFATPVTTKTQALHFQAFMKTFIDPKSHPVVADHEILAWRLMQLKLGKDGTGENGADDFVITTGHNEDGEANSGRKIVEVLTSEGAIDVAVVCSRFYGGIMLGPARFEHIATVCTEAIQLLDVQVALPPLIERLIFLDSKITSLQSSNSQPTAKNYKTDKTMTVLKAERLVAAREKRLEVLEKLKEKEPEVELAPVVVNSTVDYEPGSDEEAEFERTQGD